MPKMQAFFSKFSPGKLGSRKRLSFHPEVRRSDGGSEPIVMQLGREKRRFSNGEWIPEVDTSDELQEEIKTLRDEVSTCKEEKNMLQLRIDVLLDMLTEVMSDSLSKEKEINRLRKELVERASPLKHQLQNNFN